MIIGERLVDVLNGRSWRLHHLVPDGIRGALESIARIRGLRVEDVKGQMTQSFVDTDVKEYDPMVRNR